MYAHTQYTSVRVWLTAQTMCTWLVDPTRICTFPLHGKGCNNTIVKCTNIIHVQNVYCTVLYNIVVHMSIITIVNGTSIIMPIDDHSQWGKSMIYVYIYTSCDNNILWLCIIINSFWYWSRAVHPMDSEFLKCRCKIYIIIILWHVHYYLPTAHPGPISVCVSVCHQQESMIKFMLIKCI